MERKRRRRRRRRGGGEEEMQSGTAKKWGRGAEDQSTRGRDAHCPQW